MNLYQKLPTHVQVDGHRYRIRPWFNRVLDALDVIKGNWTEPAKCRWICKNMFYRMPMDEKAAVLALFAMLFPNADGQKNTQKLFDFEQDADYIYAAFMQAYGIDLFDQRDKLHWKKFMALFNALPSETSFSEIVGVRATPIPTLTKYNREDVQRLIKMKNQYALKLTPEEREAQFSKGLGGLFNTLENLSKE